MVPRALKRKNLVKNFEIEIENRKKLPLANTLKES